MSPEYILKGIYLLITLPCVIRMVFLWRSSLSDIATDLNLQKIEQEEIDFENKMLNLPENVIPIERRTYSEPFKEFVEDFFFFEMMHNHKDVVQYAVNRTRLIRKARRLLGK